MKVDLSGFKSAKILVIGDLMLDEYLFGEVDRISPEAPVPVVDLKSDDMTLGGAGNVVNNISALGAEVIVAGTVGTGTAGSLLIKKLEELGADIEGVIKDPARPTTKKTRIIASGQHVLRLDREAKIEISGDSLGRIMAVIEKKMTQAGAVILSDYGKGAITRESARMITSLANKLEKPVIADPKGLDFTKYDGATMITPNRKEASLAAGIEITDEKTLDAAAGKLLDTAKVEKLVITLGKDGMAVMERNASPFRIETEARQVFDVSGAGDTVAAVLGIAMAAGFGVQDAAAVANKAAGIVVGKLGTATVSIDELQKGLDPAGSTSLSNLKTHDEIAAITKDLKRRSKKIVMTLGNFELFNPGHILLFSESAKMGDVFVAAIIDNKSAQSKGLSIEQQVQILSSLDSIDYVTVFPEEDSNRLVEEIMPDVLTMESNPDAANTSARQIVEKNGGRVNLIQTPDGI